MKEDGIKDKIWSFQQKQEMNGCDKRRHTANGLQRGRCREQGQLETADLIWQSLKGTLE